MNQLSKYCGWYGTIDEFLEVDKSSWLKSLQSYHFDVMNEFASSSQVRAWQNCYNVLKKEFEQLASASKKDYVIFEYELPRERGRRPDVIVLSNNCVIVFEFKDKNIIQKADIDQTKAYARDLSNYHQESHNKNVIPFLVLTKANELFDEVNTVSVISPDHLYDSYQELLSNSNSTKVDINSWLQSDYDPLPSLIQAARELFENESLPQIRRAQSNGIPETLATLSAIAKRAQENHEKHLALITGVPGAGKTLVGLQFVYSSHYLNRMKANNAVFLSGNGPLIKVLQHALKNKIFVQDVHGFLRTYGGDSEQIPNENIWIYDEAQRAWDSERVNQKRGHGRSEPLDFLYIGEKKSDWSLMIGLIGTGQEIHLGEEGGLLQWNDALENVPSDWVVSCPSKISSIFSNASEVQIHNELNLNKTLRSHLAEELHSWVNLILESKIKEASNVAESVKKKGFDMYCTRDLQAAKDYVIYRYSGLEDKRYGILASSKAKKTGVHNEYSWTRNFRPGSWYNDHPSSKHSCCQLEEVATEFACQGLELDFPIVCWGNDLRWNDKSQLVPLKQPRSKAKNPNKLRINSYRVLLTRGRDGFVIFIPDISEMDETYNQVVKAGVLPLS